MNSVVAEGCPPQITRFQLVVRQIGDQPILKPTRESGIGPLHGFRRKPPVPFSVSISRSEF